ncbi:Ser/Thr protein kinase RdoA involved in Cpx stress response, MazF antagonist [Chryseolinea serpens]|uniref:Ser/Thr protein kinase RdoA involved in Cpx stress response, MazF antagonist n=1 Tax=Chryseolinea serpens TaxID=947013 RepID=A0A1M5RSP8_9BACT|nr:aminoglycoside phosphotransferase family protein [Chryseolinea serpens]SHH28823.1 Ser/Thr protein kinase RdoA involved in Cpx stress response, MazF antagonist [Chryseolinea serpens]
MIHSILKAYGIADEQSVVEPLVSGLINKTWKVTSAGQDYILQRINHFVFKKPYEVATNIRLVDEYLAQHHPDYLFVAPVKTLSNEDMVYNKDDGYFRMFPYIKGSHTINVVSSPDQAYEAALQFGTFARLLSNFDAEKLHDTIPDFHNLTLRYYQFDDSSKYGNAKRIKRAKAIIEDARKHLHIVEQFETVRLNKRIKRRVMHHDTKISNVLFDEKGKGLCIIDLDTVMPGYFISDVGDMMRTYLSPANEEETDFSKIEVRDDFFRAIVHGYVSSMGNELMPEERDLILYSGWFLIYMQAIRFLADYCNNDAYYGAKYEDHNFVRASNQLILLKRLEEKTDVFEKIIADELKRNNLFTLS